jgi:hypothetical protein
VSKYFVCLVYFVVNPAAVLVLSSTGTNQIREAKHKTIDNKEVCHALSSTGAERQELEVAHPSAVESASRRFFETKRGAAGL